MRSLLVPCGLALLLLTGCSSGNSNGSNSTGNSANTTGSTNTTSSTTGSNTTSSTTKAKGDFSTPKAAVETFIAAGTARDADLISRCFDAGSPGEFRKLREKTASPKELDELAEFVKGGQVLGSKETGDTALVSVKFSKRDEEIEMKKSADGWKIVDF